METETNKMIAELEKRIKILEEKLDKIKFSEAKEITMTSCSIGEVYANQSCTLSISGTIGSVFNSVEEDIDEAEGRLDELESRLEEINENIGDAEAKLDGLADKGD